jgi:hypothetical protein
MDEHLKAILDIWPILTGWQRLLIWLRTRIGLLPHPPVAGPQRYAPFFAIRAALFMFALLFVLPHHPMSMPTALGGGLAFALITY